MATPLFTYVEPWHWDTNNDGWATAAETQQSYSALINKARTNNFLRKVWNDMVLTVAYWRSITGRTWNTYYGTILNTYMNDNQPILTATMFNALVVNVGYPRYSWQFDPTLESYVGRETFKGIRDVTANYADITYAAYFIELMQAVNILIGVCNGTIERRELSITEHRSFVFVGESIALPPTPIAYNLIVRLDVVNNTELVALESYSMRIRCIDELTIDCTLSCIMSGLERVDLEMELWAIVKLNAFPARLFAYDLDIAHELITSLDICVPKYFGSVSEEIGHSDHSAELVALPIAYFEYSEQMPNMPSVANLLVRPPFSMDVLLRLLGVFDFEQTVARAFELELFFDIADIQLSAEIEHGLFKYLSGPLFFTGAIPAELNISSTAYLLYADTIASLICDSSLELTGAASFEAHVQESIAFELHGSRSLPIMLASNIVMSYSTTARLEQYSQRAFLEAAILNNLLLFSHMLLTPDTYAFTQQALDCVLNCSTKLELFDDYSLLQAHNDTLTSFVASISFVPDYSLEVCYDVHINSEVTIAPQECLALGAALNLSSAINGSMTVEGAGWLYPVRYGDDLYIRQVVKAEQDNKLLLLDALAIYVSATAYQQFVHNTDLWATTGLEASLSTTCLFSVNLALEEGWEINETLHLFTQAALDIIVPWQEPIQRHDDLYIRQAFVDDLVGMLYLYNNAKHLDTNTEILASMPATLDAYNGLEAILVISLPYNASVDALEGLQIDISASTNIAATLSCTIWLSPVQRHDDLYIRQSASVSVIDDSLNVG